MSIPEEWRKALQLPVIAAPMFLSSGPDLVVSCCQSGVIGSFPALNQRTSEGFEQWLIEVRDSLASYNQQQSQPAAPYAVNLIVHKSNPRLEADLTLCEQYQVPLIITSLGLNRELIQRVQNYGGRVFHDITNTKFARKAADAGVDGIIAVGAGGGGHAGTTSPFALMNEIRQFFEGTLVLAGCMSTGSDIASAEMMGADLAYLGTRFLATNECLVADDYKQMLVDSNAADIVYSPAISGVPANYLKQSLLNAGLDADALHQAVPITDFGSDQSKTVGDTGKKPWKDFWSAGQGVGSISSVQPAASVIQQLTTEYSRAWQAHQERLRQRGVIA